MNKYEKHGIKYNASKLNVKGQRRWITRVRGEEIHVAIYLRQEKLRG